MVRSIIGTKDVTIKYLMNNAKPLIFCKINDNWYVMAKSIIKCIDNNYYKAGEDPFIDKIENSMKADVAYFEIRDKKLFRLVWAPPANKFPKVVFVKVRSLISELPDIFQNLKENDILYIREQLQAMLATLS